MTTQTKATPTDTILSALVRRDLLLDDALIGGLWSDAEADRRFPVRNPADHTVLAQVADCGASEAARAVEAAHHALSDWRRTTPKARARLLRAWHSLIMARQDDLARILSAEQGKPLAEARGEVAYGAAYLEWFAEEAVRSDGEVITSPDGRRMIAVREPVGVVAAITPWNFPMAMLARKIAPALAAGCTLVCKPAEDTPISALAIAKLAQEAGIPDGVINIVTASRERAGEVVDVWQADGRVRKLSFTGSTTVGKLLARGAADTVKRLSLELGGNAPLIVFDDADLDVAVRGAMTAKFRNAGQTCVSPNRFFVQAGIHDAFVARLKQAVETLKVGSADEPDAQIGPLINAKAIDKVAAHVDDALASGARLVTGGKRLARDGFFEPTILIGMSPQMEASCEETFGPVVAIQTFDTEEAVIAAANDTPYGLAAYVFTNDRKRIARLGVALETGMIGVNEGAISSEVAPFGGVKQSGYGREGSSHGLGEYQVIKYICEGDVA